MADLDLDALERLADDECEDVARLQRCGCGEAPSVRRRAIVADAFQSLVRHVRSLDAPRAPAHSDYHDTLAADRAAALRGEL